MARARKKTSVRTNVGKADTTANWADLTWNDLERWAGRSSVQRGRTYQRQGRVKDMGITRDGRLLATVTGTQRYVVSVWLGQNRKDAGKLKSQCTCPVGSSGCKHAVAVVVDLLEKLGDGQKIAELASDDRRWTMLADEQDGMDIESLDDETLEENLEDDRKFSSVPRKHPNAAASGKRSPTLAQWNEKITTYIHRKSRKELAAFVMKLVERFPELRQELVERIVLETGDGEQLLKEARREMRRITAKIGWQNHWDNEGHTPDYSQLKHKLERLVEMGYGDRVVTLGHELLDRGIQQIGQSDDEGETATELSDCLLVVFHALQDSSLSAVDKINYVIDACLRDEYEVIDDAIDPVLALGLPQDWVMVADRLRAQLDKLPACNHRSDFSQRYHRDRVSGWLLHALQKAGCEDALQSVYEKEARATGSYQRLVTYLLEKGDHEAVYRWAYEGIERTRESWPGIASSLAGSLCELARRKKQWDIVAVHGAYAFFDRPSRHTFADLIDKARQARCSRKVRAMALTYLETGQSPVKVTRAGNDRVAAKVDDAWPLPVPDYLQSLWPRESQQPHWDVLLDMAIADKRPGDVLHWFDRMMDEGQARRQPRVGLDWQERVADAVAQSHPLRALAIRQQQLATLLPQTGVRAYESATACLRKIKPLLVALNRSDEWDQQITATREKYKNRPRFMEILDKLDNRSILQAKQARRSRR